MEIFAERLKLLRKQKGCTQKQMATLLECTLQHYQRIEYGKINLPMQSLIVLADFLGTSLDYLVGRSDVPISNIETNESIKELTSNPRKNAAANLIAHMDEEQVQKAYDFLCDQKQLGELRKKNIAS